MEAPKSDERQHKVLHSSSEKTRLTDEISRLKRLYDRKKKRKQIFDAVSSRKLQRNDMNLKEQNKVATMKISELEFRQICIPGTLNQNDCSQCGIIPNSVDSISSSVAIDSLPGISQNDMQIENMNSLGIGVQTCSSIDQRKTGYETPRSEIRSSDGKAEVSVYSKDDEDHVSVERNESKSLQSSRTKGAKRFLRDTVMVEDKVALLETELFNGNSILSQESCVPETQLSGSAGASETSTGYVGGSERSQNSLENRLVRRARPSRAGKRRLRITGDNNSLLIFPKPPIKAIQTRMDHFSLPDDAFGILKSGKMFETLPSNISDSVPSPRFENICRRLTVDDNILTCAFCRVSTSVQVFVVVSVLTIGICSYRNSKWFVNKMQNNMCIQKIVASSANTSCRLLALCVDLTQLLLRELTVSETEVTYGDVVYQLDLRNADDLAFVALSERRIILYDGCKLISLSKASEWTKDSEFECGTIKGLCSLRQSDKVFVAYFGSKVLLRHGQDLTLLKVWDLEIMIRTMFAVDYEEGLLLLTLLSSDSCLQLVALNCSNDRKKVVIQYKIEAEKVMVMPKHIAVLSEGALWMVDRFDGRVISLE